MAERHPRESLLGQELAAAITHLNRQVCLLAAGGVRLVWVSGVGVRVWVRPGGASLLARLNGANWVLLGRMQARCGRGGSS